MLWVRHASGIWVYPIMAHLSPAGLMVFLSVASLSMAPLYLLGEKLNRVIWGSAGETHDSWPHQCKVLFKRALRLIGLLNIILNSINAWRNCIGTQSLTQSLTLSKEIRKRRRNETEMGIDHLQTTDRADPSPALRTCFCSTEKYLPFTQRDLY